MLSARKQVFAALAAAAMLLVASAPARAQAGGQTGPPPSPGKWGRMAPLPEKSEEFTFGDVNGKIYLFGGLPLGTKPPLGLVQEYDPATDKWTQKKNMPLATHHAAIASYNGKLYLFGGQAQLEPGGPTQIPLNNTWEYDPANDSWKALAPMPTARTAAVAATVDGKIYVFGGASVHPGQKIVSLGPNVPHRSLDTNEVYDVKTNTWATKMTMPTARNHAAAGVVNGKIYVIGGRVGAAFIGVASNTDVVEEYDPVSDTWGAIRARMPTPRSAMASGVHNNRIYVTGGEGQTSTYMMTFRALEAYDPAANRWTVLPNMPVSRHGLAGGVVGNRLHMVSGDVQSAGTGVHVDSESHDAYEFEAAKCRARGSRAIAFPTRRSSTGPH